MVGALRVEALAVDEPPVDEHPSASPWPTGASGSTPSLAPTAGGSGSSSARAEADPGEGQGGVRASELDQGRGELRFALTLLLPRDAASVPMVRHLCAQALRETGAAESAVADVELAITEACANVVRHASGGSSYEVTATLSATTCQVRVRDHGKGLPAGLASGAVTGGQEAEGGRGLGLIRFLMDDLALGNEAGDGAVVQMSKHLPPSSDR